MMYNDNVQEAVSAGIRHIGISIYSSGKIRDYLIRKGFSDKAARLAVDELVERNYIDDRRAGRKVLLLRTGTKQESKNLLYSRLTNAGIDSSVAASMVQELEDDKETISRLISFYDINTDEDREAFIKVAMRRGYTYDLAVKAINSI